MDIVFLIPFLLLRGGCGKRPDFALSVTLRVMWSPARSESLSLRQAYAIDNRPGDFYHRSNCGGTVSIA
jgi:hypothetical protein